jgi:hypothetical protein
VNLNPIHQHRTSRKHDNEQAYTKLTTTTTTATPPNYMIFYEI